MSVSDGDNATFMCMVDLTDRYELQWSHNGDLLPGENQSSLTVSDVTAVQGGNYTCLVVNAVGSDTDEGILYGKCFYSGKIKYLPRGSVQCIQLHSITLH